MCGRFTQRYTWSEVLQFLRVFGPARNLQPHYNIAPTMTVDVIRLDESGNRELVPMRWGLIPALWVKSLKEIPATFNARAESVADILSCTIIVCGANKWMETYHDRMPVILDEKDFDGWLNGSLGADALKCASESALREWLVSRRINKAGEGDEDPTVIEPLISEETA